MARTTSLSIESLAPLGVGALAALLISHAEEDAALRKKLKLPLAGTEGAGKLAAEKNPTVAIGLLWDFIALATGVMNRLGEPGPVEDIFDAAMADLGWADDLKLGLEREIKEIDRQRGVVVAQIEGKLEQKIAVEPLFNIRWRLV
jgi:hypothetical protein